MIFDSADWVFLGGSLVMGPIASRCLLVRLHDLNCSFLFYHEITVVHGEEEESFGRIPAAATSLKLDLSVREASIMKIHGPGPADGSLESLLAMPAILVPLPSNRTTILPGTVVSTNRFGPVEIWVAGGVSPLGKLNVVFRDPGEGWSSYLVDGLDYVLRSSSAFHAVGREAEAPLWRLSVVVDGVEINWKSTADWELVGLYADADWAVHSEVRLERRGSEDESMRTWTSI